MPTSYREENNLYKNAKKSLVDGYEETSYKKKKTKNRKRADHKHHYVPVVCYDDKDNPSQINYGYVCDQCGRINDMYFTWIHYPERVKEFQLQNPDYIEVTLPKNWSWFKDKNLPIDRGLA